MTEAPALNGAARSPGPQPRRPVVRPARSTPGARSPQPPRPPLEASPSPAPAPRRPPRAPDAAHHAHRPHHAGGRLKFYKDGKFILELARSQDAWVSVPKKTYWPPPAPHAPSSAASPLSGATAVTSGNAHPSTAPVSSHHRLERAPSLSVSDDNSSIQSSPWQRDQRWKQSTPQRNISKELAGIYVRPAELPTALLMMPSARQKRRRPFDIALVTFPNGSPVSLTNGTGNHSPENCNDEIDSSSKLNSPMSDEQKSAALEKRVGKFKFFKQFSETKEHVKLRVYKKCRKLKKRTELCKIVEILNEKLPTQTVSTITTKIPLFNCKQEHMMVSPRKRILRELERVSLEDKANKRPRSRATTVIPKAGPSQSSSDNNISVNSPSPQNHYNGTPQTISRREPSTSKAISSYSIISLLNKSDESPPRRSPDLYPSKKSSQFHSFVPHKTESPVSVHSPDLSSSPDTLERHRSMRHIPYVPPPFTSSSHSNYTSGSPRMMDKYYHDNYVNHEEPAQVPYQVYVPQYLPPTPYLSTTYPPYPPRAPVHLWSHYPIMPPGIWAPLPQPLLTDHMAREDASSDVPLNLSKH